MRQHADDRLWSLSFAFDMSANDERIAKAIRDWPTPLVFSQSQQTGIERRDYYHGPMQRGPALFCCRSRRHDLDLQSRVA